MYPSISSCSTSPYISTGLLVAVRTDLAGGGLEGSPSIRAWYLARNISYQNPWLLDLFRRNSHQDRDQYLVFGPCSVVGIGTTHIVLKCLYVLVHYY
eukprot:3186085-Rhodomonas_salina.1